jgi:hypothetical protein
MLDHLLVAYGNITAVDLENNFEQMRRAWDPQKPVESLFKQIQDCPDYSEEGGILIGHPQQINVGYEKQHTPSIYVTPVYTQTKYAMQDETPPITVKQCDPTCFTKSCYATLNYLALKYIVLELQDVTLHALP